MARPQPSLRFADGGSFITRWAEGVMRPNATAKRLREIEAPPPPPPAQPPAPPPPPPNPRVTKDNPAGIRFQDGGFIESAKDAIQNVGDYWSGDNATFEAGNPGVGQRVMRAVNPMTGFGSAIGAVQDAAGSGDLAGAALAGAAALPPFAAARALKVAQPVAQGALARAGWGNSMVAPVRAETAKAVGRNTAVGTAADYYEPQPPGLRFQDGGHVPGSGEGDKIPAKYEPGEFVVSNDMIDDNPGLREGLANMRAQTLAARGKTVEEADAKALRYHGGFDGGRDGQEAQDEEFSDVPRLQRQGVEGVGAARADGRGGRARGDQNPQRVSLRAADGFGDEFYRGQASPADRAAAQQAANSARNAALPPTPNTIVQGPDGSALPGQKYPGRDLVPQGGAQSASRALVPVQSPPPAPGTALARTADIGNNGYKPNFTMGGDGSPTRPMPEGIRPGEAGELSQNARAQAAARAQGRVQAQASGAALNEANAATRAASGAATPAAGAGSGMFGSAQDWKNLVGSQKGSLRLNPVEAPGRLGKGFGVLQGAVGAYDAYQGVKEGDALRAGVGAADTLAAGALFTPAAPAAGAYLGARGAWEGGKAAGDYLGSKLSDNARDAIGGTINQIGLNTGLWGTDDSDYLQQKPSGPAAPAAKPAGPDANNPYAAANARKIAESDAKNAAAGASAQSSEEFDRQQNSLRRIDRPGQSPLYTNVPDGGMLGNDALMGRRPMTAQNLAAGENLAARSEQESMGRLRQAQYDREVAQAQAINQGQAAQSQSYDNRLRQWNDITSDVYKARRSLQMDMTSMNSHMTAEGQAMAKTKAAREGLAELTKTHFGMAGGDRDDATKRYQSDNTLRGAEGNNDATRYSADQELRGDYAQAGATRGTGALKQQENAAYGAAFQQAGGDPVKAAQIAASMGLDPSRYTGMAAADQTRGHHAATNATQRLEGMAVRPDGKGGSEVDKGRLAQLRSTMTKIAPGWERMNETKQAEHLGKAEASVNLLEGMNSRRNHGFLQSLGIDGKSPSLDQLPSMKGAKLTPVGLREGATTGGDVSRGDYKVEVNGHTLYLPRDKVNQGELELLKERGVDISGAAK